ncbi:GerAB/ArcD/ProY family transporter [Psychrobacillus sp. FSL K6-2836]|uniref:GerAB/ArcD/ProY family transporter n=1 Tax=Psychrobacillus sp. FSL K6-2836 TaxID=2921548 RepID=UPI0030F78C1B
MPNDKINSYQFLVLVILFTVGTSILIVPSALVAVAKQDGWIAAILGTGIGIVIVWVFTKISLWFPNITFVQLIETLFGKWIGKAFSLIFVCMVFLYTITILYHSGTFLTTHVMPNTPVAATNILMASCII